MRTLVTGAAGFIGTHLTKGLAERGHSVVALDVVELQHEVAILPNVIPLIGDIRNASLVLDAMKQVDVVFHQAAVASVPESFLDPAFCLAVNVEGSATILEQARQARVRRVVMASTSAVYGDDPSPVKSEGLVPQPRSPYAVSKLAMEQMADVYARVYGLETVALRYFNVYGPGQSAHSGYAAVVPSLIESLTSNRTFQVFGDGKQTRSFVFVQDVVRANILAAMAPVAPEEGVLITNITSNDVVSLMGLVDTVVRASGRSLNIEFLDERAGDVKHSSGSHKRASEALGFDAEVTLHDGIMELLRNCE